MSKNCLSAGLRSSKWVFYQYIRTTGYYLLVGFVCRLPTLSSEIRSLSVLPDAHVCHSANCGEFQTTRPRLQVPGFKSSLFKSSCCNLNKILSFIQLTRDREGLYHWEQYGQVPLTFTYEEATQESCRNVKCNMSTISFHNMDASKYIYRQNISMGKIYLWVKYILNINMNHDF